MYILYIDESGNTGTDYDNKSQPVFVLAGIRIKDSDWHTVNDFFEKEKIKIYPEFANNEIHTSELFNSNKKSIYNKYDWKDNLNALEKVVDLICNCNVSLYYTSIVKSSMKKFLATKFKNSVKIDPYLYAFANMYNSFNSDIEAENSYGIIFSDKLDAITDGMELLYPKLLCNNRNIIEQAHYLDSKKNNFIQMADICALYINKYICITKGICTYNDIKTEHCLKMHKKIMKLIDNYQHSFGSHTFLDINKLFE